MASDSRSSARQPLHDVVARKIDRKSGRTSRASHQANVGPAEGGSAPEADAYDERCPLCQSPKCLALVRADEPPADWKDLVDRLVMLVCSGHWSWRKTANLVVALSCLTLLLYACVGNKVPVVIEYLGVSPLRWGPFAGCCVLASAGFWRVRRGRGAAGRQEHRGRGDRRAGKEPKT